MLQKKDLLSEECRKHMRKSMVLMMQDFKIGIDAPHSNHIDVKEYAVSQVDETTEGENAINYSCRLSNF